MAARPAAPGWHQELTGRIGWRRLSGENMRHCSRGIGDSDKDMSWVDRGCPARGPGEERRGSDMGMPLRSGMWNSGMWEWR